MPFAYTRTLAVAAMCIATLYNCEQSSREANNSEQRAHPRNAGAQDVDSLPPECAGAAPYRYDDKGIVPPTVRHGGRFQPATSSDPRHVVVMEVIVRRDGRPCAAAVIRDGARSRREYVDDVLQWEFIPARRGGAAVDVHTVVGVDDR